MISTTWEALTLGDLGKWVTGSTPPSSDNANWGDDVSFVTPGDIGYGGKLGDVARRISNIGADRVRRVKPGSVILVCIGTIGKVAWTDQEITTNQQINTLEVDQSRFDIRFVHWLLASPSVQEKLWHNSTSTTVALINKKTLEKIPCSVPPLDEQRRIVETLDDHLSRLDKALAELDRSEVLAKSLLASAMSTAFSDAQAPRKAIGEFAEVKGGKRLPKGTPWSPAPTAHPYIRSTDIKAGLIDEENLVFVPDVVWDSISRYTVAEGDVLVTIAGTIGQTGVVSSKLHGANLTENAAKIVAPRDLVEPHFLEMYLRSPRVSQEMQFLARATTQPKLALYRIQEILVPLPPLGEQVAILDRLHKVQDAHRVSQTRVQELQRQISDLRRSLLHSAFEGKLLNGFNNE